MDPVTISLIGTVIQTLVLPLLLMVVKGFFDSKKDAIKNKDTRAAIEFALDRLNYTAQTVVMELNQTSKKLGADGKLSKEDATLLLQSAYSALSTRLPADALATLQAVYGDKLPSIMTGTIEATVAAAK
jgi:hypothetical protein